MPNDQTTDLALQRAKRLNRYFGKQTFSIEGMMAMEFHDRVIEAIKSVTEKIDKIHETGYAIMVEDSVDHRLRIYQMLRTCLRYLVDKTLQKKIDRRFVERVIQTFTGSYDDESLSRLEDTFFRLDLKKISRRRTLAMYGKYRHLQLFKKFGIAPPKKPIVGDGMVRLVRKTAEGKIEHG